MTTDTIAPDVRAFLDAVRGDLADLDPDEQAEILDGLEADLSELVAERGPQALDDPRAYARELRAAAGLAEVGSRRGRGSVRQAVDGLLDGCHDRFDSLVGRLPGGVRPLLAWAQPLWWLVRAWLAVQLLEILASSDYRFTLVPGLRGFGWPVLALAVVLSVQLGRGRFWPGGERGLGARLVVIGLNAFAIVLAVPVLDGTGQDQRFWDGYERGLEAAQDVVVDDSSTARAGVLADGRRVSNIYPYDAQGRPIAGVQLYDQAGKPINVVTQPECEYDPRPGQPAPTPAADTGTTWCAGQGYDSVLPLVLYPWTNGAAQLYNVFPLPARVQPEPKPTATAFTGPDRPALGPYPLATVPPASLPGVPTGVVTPPAPAPAAD